MDLRRSTEMSLLAGRDFAGKQDPYVALRTAELVAMAQAATAAGEEATLAVPWSCIELEGAAALGRVLRGNAAITSVNLSANALGDGGALALAAAVRGSRSALRALNLSSNKIGDSGAAAVASLLAACPLEELTLSGNAIGDLGANSLAQAVQASATIQRLFLGDNNIGDAGADSLADALAARPKQIAVLWLGHQRPPLDPPPMPVEAPPERLEGAVAAMERRIEQELARKETWPSTSAYGNKLAEARESSLSSAARLEAASMELRARLDTATQAAPAAGASAEGADGGGTGRLAELNASNEALQGRVDFAKQRLAALERASGKQIDELLSTAGGGGGAPVAAARRPAAVVGHGPKGHSFLRSTGVPGAAYTAEWNKLDGSVDPKPPEVDVKPPEEPAPREGPSIVEGSLITSTIPTTGAWP